MTTDQIKKHRNPISLMVVTDKMSEQELKKYANYIRSKLELQKSYKALTEVLIAGFLYRPSKPMSWSTRQIFYATPRQLEEIRSVYSSSQTQHWNLAIEAVRHAYILQNNSYAAIKLITESYELIRQQLIDADTPPVRTDHGSYLAEDFMVSEHLARLMREDDEDEEEEDVEDIIVRDKSKPRPKAINSDDTRSVTSDVSTTRFTRRPSLPTQTDTEALRLTQLRLDLEAQQRQIENEKSHSEKRNSN
jgi:hypothetical protein